MDTDVKIFTRQYENGVNEKYILYKRLDELVEELTEVKERLKKLEKSELCVYIIPLMC